MYVETRYVVDVEGLRENRKNMFTEEAAGLTIYSSSWLLEIMNFKLKV